MKLHHIALICKERDRTVKFYQVLGFKITNEYIRLDKDDIMILMSNGYVVLEIFVKKDCPNRPSHPEAYGLRHLALRTENIENDVNNLIKNGYNPEPIRRDTFTNEQMTFVADPDGLPIELHE